jgi:hypothetical protein
MKLRKHLNLKSEKVLIVLFALLFATTSVHTLAIVRGSQPAQVTSIGSCVQVVSHKYNQFFSNPFDANPSAELRKDDYLYKISLDIKNNCTRPVSIINPGSMSQFYPKSESIRQINSFALENLGPAGTPENVSMAPGNFYGIDYSAEYGLCVSCGSGSMVYRLSPLGVDTQPAGLSIATYNIPVGQTRTFEFGLSIGLPHSASDFASGWLRAKLKSFKWTYTNSYQNDGFVMANEIQTVSLSSAQQESFATDYVISGQDGGVSEYACADGLNYVLNNLNQPDCQ